MLGIKKILSALLVLGTGFTHSSKHVKTKVTGFAEEIDPQILKMYKNGRVFVLNTKKLPDEYKKLKKAINSSYSKWASELGQKELDKVRECKGGFEEIANLVLEAFKHVFDNLDKITRESFSKHTLDAIKDHNLFEETSLEEVKVGDTFLYISNVDKLQMVEIFRLKSPNQLSSLQFAKNGKHLEPLILNEHAGAAMSEYMWDILLSNFKAMFTELFINIRNMFVDSALQGNPSVNGFVLLTAPLTTDLSEFKMDMKKYNTQTFRVILQSLSTVIPCVVLAKHKQSKSNVLIRTLGFASKKDADTTDHNNIKCEYVVLKDGEFVSATQKESAKFVEENSDKFNI